MDGEGGQYELGHGLFLGSNLGSSTSARSPSAVATDFFLWSHCCITLVVFYFEPHTTGAKAEGSRRASLDNLVFFLSHLHLQSEEGLAAASSLHGSPLLLHHASLFEPSLFFFFSSTWLFCLLILSIFLAHPSHPLSSSSFIFSRPTKSPGSWSTTTNYNQFSSSSSSPQVSLYYQPD